jgi:hypothetical protein
MKNSQPAREALLDDGRIVEYDVYSRDKYTYADLFYLYLGAGTIYRINGAAVRDTGRKFFYLRKKNTEEPSSSKKG